MIGLRFGRLVSAIVATSGAVLLIACETATTPSSPPSAPAAGAAVRYTAIGASDAIGVGASVMCAPYAECPDGTGYVPDIVRQLRAGGSTVTLVNLGIPGAVTGADIQSIAEANGNQNVRNFIEHEMPFVPRDSTLVTIFAGANDTRTIAAALARGAGGVNPSGYIDAQVQMFAADYLALIRGIRSRAPAAWIVVANLPNFAGLPYASGYSITDQQYLQKISVAFTLQAINTLASQSVPVVDLMCDARSYQAGTYSSDGFHPNDTGYAYIASKYLGAIRAGSAPAPPSSCAQMTLVPPIQ